MHLSSLGLIGAREQPITAGFHCKNQLNLTFIPPPVSFITLHLSVCLKRLAPVCPSLRVTGDVIKQDEAIGRLCHRILTPVEEEEEESR